MSQFGAEKFTTRSREVIEAAQLAATTGGNTHTEPVHLLVALLKQEDGTSRSLVQKAGVDPATLLAKAEGAQQQLPRATGSTVQTASKIRCRSGTSLWPGSSQAERQAVESKASQTTAHSRRIGASSASVARIGPSASPARPSQWSAKTIADRATRESSVHLGADGS